LAAYTGTGLKPDQILAMNKQFKGLQAALDASQDEKKLLGQKITRLQTELDRYVSPDKPVYLPASLIGKVLVTDPKWNFVVLNIGLDQGVKEYGELLVNRNGKLVAKVIIRSAQKDRCIANVMPGWQLGEVMEGDQVTPAHPES
jgi:cell shape-determining protein MreC